MSDNILNPFRANRDIENEGDSGGKMKSNRTSQEEDDGSSADDGGPVAHTASSAVAEALKREYRERLQAAAAKEAERDRKMEEAKAARQELTRN